MKKITIEKGQIFSNLSILEEVERHITSSGYSKRQFRCECTCGNVIKVVIGNLRSGNTTSCGCQREVTKRNNRGNVYSPSLLKYTYCSYKHMISRCTNIDDKAYERYGGAGIKVCEHWLDSFDNFYEDMGDRPEGHTLNRVNNATLYSKDTCEWATPSMQAFDQKIRNTNTSGKTGVHFSEERGKWVASICKNNKNIILGRFDTKEEAIAVRIEAEIDLFGFTKE